MARKYPREIREKAVSLIRNGMPKLRASRMLGIPYRTVVDWTFDIKTRRAYPKRLKRQIRRLVRIGVTKRDASKMLGVGYQTVVYWTSDMKSQQGRTGIRGSSLKVLRLLVERGYVLSNEVKTASSLQTLRKYIPLRRVKIRRIKKQTIWIMPNMERKAMEAYLEFVGKRSIGYRELGYLRKAFGIKNMKRNNKLRERFLK